MRLAPTQRRQKLNRMKRHVFFFFFDTTGWIVSRTHITSHCCTKCASWVGERERTSRIKPISLKRQWKLSIFMTTFRCRLASSNNCICSAMQLVTANDTHKECSEHYHSQFGIHFPHLTEQPVSGERDTPNRLQSHAINSFCILPVAIFIAAV